MGASGRGPGMLGWVNLLEGVLCVLPTPRTPADTGLRRSHGILPPQIPRQGAWGTDLGPSPRSVPVNLATLASGPLCLCFHTCTQGAVEYILHGGHCTWSPWPRADEPKQKTFPPALCPYSYRTIPSHPVPLGTSSEISLRARPRRRCSLPGSQGGVRRSPQPRTRQLGVRRSCSSQSWGAPRRSPRPPPQLPAPCVRGCWKT